MASTRVEELLLRFKIAQGDLARVKKTLGEAQRDLNTFKKEETSFSVEADKAVRSLQAEAIAAEKAKKGLKDATGETKDFTKATKDAAKAANDLGSAQGGGSGGGRRRNALTRAGADIRGLPAIPIPNSNLSTDVFGKMLAVLGGLNPVAVAVTAAVGGLVVGLKIMTAEAQRTTEALIAGQNEVITAIKQSTSEEIREKIKAKQVELEVVRARIEENKRLLNAVDEAGPVVRGIFDALDVGGTQQLRVETQLLEAQERAAALASDRLTQSLSSQEVAANDLIAAYEAKLERVDRQNELRIQAEINANNLNSESVRRQITALQDEIAVRQKYIDANKYSAEATTEAKKRVDDLSASLRALQGLTPEIDASTKRDETVAAVQRYNDEIAKIEEAQLAKRLALNEKYADQVIAIAEKAAEAAENALRKLQEQQAKLALDLGRAGLDAERQAEYDQIDAQVEFQREEAKAYRDHVAELKKIRRNANRDEADAVSERDVLAFIQARQAKKEAIDAENEDFKRDRREREIKYAQDRQDQKTQYDRERQERYIKYQRDLEDAQSQYNREIVLAEQKRVQDLARAQLAYQQDTALLTQKYSQERTLRSQAIAQELSLIQRGYAARLAIDAAYYNAALAQAQRLMSPAAGVTPSSSSSPKPGFTNRNLPGFDTGGVITRTGAAIVHKGEIITNPRRGQGTGMTVNIIGTSRAQMIKDFTQAVIEAGY